MTADGAWVIRGGLQGHLSTRNQVILVDLLRRCYQDQDRVQGLLDVRHQETGGELMHFRETINWMRCTLPDLAALKGPLRAILEDYLRGAPRTRRVADRRELSDDDWTSNCVAALGTCSCSCGRGSTNHDLDTKFWC